MTHDELAHDLANERRAIGEIVAERLVTGPGFGRAPQMDVFSIRPSWTKPFPTCWEVKVTRSDFLRDVRTAKYEAYLPNCRRLYFATPAGLVKRDEVPKGMGLTTRNENGWHVVKAPKTRPLDSDTHAITLMALLLRLNAPGFNPRADEDRAARVQRYLKTRDMGKVVCEQVRDDMARAKEMRRDAERARARLAKLLARDDDATVGQMVNDVISEGHVEIPTVPDELKQAAKDVRSAMRQAARAMASLEDEMRRVENRV